MENDRTNFAYKWLLWKLGDTDEQPRRQLDLFGTDNRDWITSRHATSIEQSDQADDSRAAR